MVPKWLVSDSKYCSHCGRQPRRLTPFRPHWHEPMNAIPVFCDDCRKREREAWRNRANITAERWAQHQTELAALEGWQRVAYRERYRGMLREKPWPKQGRVPSFVWDIPEPRYTLVTEYSRGLRYLKTTW